VSENPQDNPQKSAAPEGIPTISPDAEVDTVVNHIATSLGENQQSPIHTITRIVDHLGKPFALEMLNRTLEVEAQGGMMTLDGSRRRTPGGVFFHLVNTRLREEGNKAALQDIFPAKQRPRRFEPDQNSRTYHPPPPPVQRLRPRKRVQEKIPLDERPIVNPFPPNQAEIIASLERHLGTPDDLYKRSINPKTGEITLSFYFPNIAKQKYGDAIARIEEERGVVVSISQNYHQGALMEVAQNVLPPHVTMVKANVVQAEQTMQVEYVVDDEEPYEFQQYEQEAAKEAFSARTGWVLELRQHTTPRSHENSLTPHHIVVLAQDILGKESGLGKVSVYQDERSILLRFAFPDIAKERYAHKIAALEQKTGWKVSVYPETNQSELIATAKEVLPNHLTLTRTPAIHREQRTVVVFYQGEGDDSLFHVAKKQFTERTGWTLELADQASNG
jgi:hypothetical protein